jgi:hypothetical protein
MTKPQLWTGQDEEKLRYRLIVLGIPRCYIEPYLALVNSWRDHNGEEWTILRLKSLKVDLFRRKAGLHPLTWIRKNRSGDVAGVIGGILRWSDCSERNFRITIQVLMLYTHWYAKTVTEKQFKKFYSGVTAEPTLISSKLIKSISRQAKKFAYQGAFRSPDPILSYEGSSEKKSPRLFGQKSTPQCDNVLDELQYFNTSGGMYLYAKYRSIFEPLLAGFESRKGFLNNLDSSRSSEIPHVGNIAFIQEPGGKLRSVASPFRLLQEALRPFGDKLYQAARKMPWDCTHDQSAAFDPIRLSLKQGKPVYSVDLSSATDFFPLEIQAECIRSIVGPSNSNLVDLWVELSRGTWFLPDKSTIRWSRGQPLGMYPSFAAFTITHGMLLKSLLNRRWNGEFFVVGDDVTILDDELASKYFRTLDEIGCPYSTDKTLQSEKIAEFAGKVITSDGVYPQMKWRELSDDNFLDLCRALGPRSRLLLRSRQRRIFDKVKNLCEPIGLNFSLPGDNLTKAVIRTMDSPLWNPEASILKSLMGLRRRVHKNLYSYELWETISETEVSEMISTFDEKVRSVMVQTLFSHWENASKILDGLASLPVALDLEPRLPLEHRLPSRVTTLERYEAVLGQLT